MKDNNNKEFIRNKLDGLFSEIGGNNYKSKANDFLKKLRKLEAQTEETETLAVFLNFILDNYSLSLQPINKINQANKQILMEISSKFSVKPFTYIGDQIIIFICESPEIKKMIQIFQQIYENQQRIHIEKFYSKIKVRTLESYFGSKFNASSLTKYGWIKEKDYFIIPSKKNTSVATGNDLTLISDLQFLGKMNVQTEKLAQENQNLIPY